MTIFLLIFVFGTIGVWQLTKSWAILGSYWLSMLILLAVCGVINYLLIGPVR